MRDGLNGSKIHKIRVHVTFDEKKPQTSKALFVFLDSKCPWLSYSKSHSAYSRETKENDFSTLSELAKSVSNISLCL